MTFPPNGNGQHDHDEENCGCCSCPGPQGPMGIQGMQGPQGLQGPAGLNGAPGNQGPMGPMGPSGQMGSVGPQGLQGATGPMGQSGPQGPTGPAGADGKDGKDGGLGPQGSQGNSGPQGNPGLQGLPGKNCDCHRVYLAMFSEIDQHLGANGSGTDFAKMTSLGALSSPLDFDISMAATTGVIQFLKTGVYTLAWSTDGMLEPPFPFPVPSWGLGLYINGVFVNGSGTAGFSQSPDDDATCLTSVQNLSVAAGDKIVLKNITMNPIFLKSIQLPSVIVPVTCASFSAIKIS